MDTAAREERLPTSEGWALSILRHPDTPLDKEYDDADLALGVGRDVLVRRGVSQLRKQHDEEELTIAQCAENILETVKSFGLETVTPPPIPQPISKEDLSIVCYQVVLPRI